MTLSPTILALPWGLYLCLGQWSSQFTVGRGLNENHNHAFIVVFSNIYESKQEGFLRLNTFLQYDRIGPALGSECQTKVPCISQFW